MRQAARDNAALIRDLRAPSCVLCACCVRACACRAVRASRHVVPCTISTAWSQDVPADAPRRVAHGPLPSRSSVASPRSTPRLGVAAPTRASGSTFVAATDSPSPRAPATPASATCRTIVSTSRPRRRGPVRNGVPVRAAPSSRHIQQPCRITATTSLVRSLQRASVEVADRRGCAEVRRRVAFERPATTGRPARSSGRRDRRYGVGARSARGSPRGHAASGVVTARAAPGRSSAFAKHRVGPSSMRTAMLEPLVSEAWGRTARARARRTPRSPSRGSGSR